MGGNASTLADALRAASLPVDLTIYDGARHELLNETNRAEVTADIVGWLRSCDEPPRPDQPGGLTDGDGPEQPS